MPALPANCAAPLSPNSRCVKKNDLPKRSISDLLSANWRRESQARNHPLRQHNLCKMMAVDLTSWGLKSLAGGLIKLAVAKVRNKILCSSFCVFVVKLSHFHGIGVSVCCLSQVNIILLCLQSASATSNQTLSSRSCLRSFQTLWWSREQKLQELQDLNLPPTFFWMPILCWKKRILKNVLLNGPLQPVHNW